MSRISIVHLVDSDASCSLRRVLTFLQSNPRLSRQATHSVQTLRGDTLALGRIQADMIVSHLPIAWRRLPALMSLRAMNPTTPLVHMEHHLTEAYAARKYSRLKRLRSLLRTTYALFDRVVAVSRAQAMWMMKADLVSPHALTVIPAVVDCSSLRRVAPVTGAAPRVIGAIGRLEEQQGFDTLLRAFRALADPDLRLEIYGEGPEWDSLSSLALEDPRVQLRGSITDRAKAFNRMDALAMPSRWDPHGLTATEARAAGRPVLVAPVDALQDHIAEGAIGVDGHDVKAWTAALRDLVTGQTDCRPPAPGPKPEDRFVDSWSTLVDELTGNDRLTALAV